MSKITNLPAAEPLDGTEKTPVVQDGQTRRTTIAAMIALGAVIGIEGAAVMAAILANFAKKSGLDDVGDPEWPLSHTLAEISNADTVRFRQMLHANLFRMNSVGGGLNIIGDSISHGAHCGNAYTNHWAMLLARAVCAEFETSSIGFIPMEHVFNYPGAPFQTDQIHDVLFSGADWGPRHPANPPPYDYPLGNFGPVEGEHFGLGSDNIVNGKSYSSSVVGATITISTVPLTERLFFLVTTQPGGGTFNVTVNGANAGTITTDSPVKTYNVERSIAMADNGKGSCTVVLTKADANPTEINAVIGYRSSNIQINSLSKRMTLNNFSRSGHALSNMSEQAIIRASNAVGLVMSLGYNDVNGYATDTDDAAFNRFRQRIDWLIYYCGTVYKTPVVVQDFIWNKSIEQSRTRRELRRLAKEIGGIYIPYPDHFIADRTLPSFIPLQLNDPMYLFADAAHPGPLGNELIFSTLSTAIGFAVRSKRQALEQWDWAWPLNITHVDWANATPNLVRSISSVRQVGSAYRFKLNLDYLPAGGAPANLYTICNGISPKYRDNQSPQFMFETAQFWGIANDLVFTQNNFVVGLSTASGLVQGIKKSLTVEGQA